MNAGLFVVAQAFNRPVFSFNSWNLCCKDLLKFPKVDLPSIYYIDSFVNSLPVLHEPECHILNTFSPSEAIQQPD